MVVKLNNNTLKKLGIGSEKGGSKEQKGVTKKPTKTKVKVKEIKACNSSLMCSSDYVEIDKNAKSITLILDGAKTISHNEILRQHYATLDSYNKSWYLRIGRLVESNKKLIDSWLNLVSGNLLVFEGLEYSSSARDTDSSSGSFKPLVDGLVKAGLIKDDSPKFLLTLPPLPVKSSQPKIVLRLRPCPKLDSIFSHDFATETFMGK
ncbi:hypothetical protein ABJY94_19050 [Vibrio parahaemolyticus]|uniref:hypothetical protein n=1 Tax=Vibrio parahaemolyticus TaxID=670 RepID=UPI0032AF34D4